MTSSAKPDRRPATRAEARALAHPLRLRIIRLCLDEALTNREIAQALYISEVTVKVHVVGVSSVTGFGAALIVTVRSTRALESRIRDHLMRLGLVGDRHRESAEFAHLTRPASDSASCTHES